MAMDAPHLSERKALGWRVLCHCGARRNSKYQECWACRQGVLRKGANRLCHKCGIPYVYRRGSGAGFKFCSDECFKASKSKKRLQATRTSCACGGVKSSTRVAWCRSCHAAKHARKRVLCECGREKGKASIKCVACHRATLESLRTRICEWCHRSFPKKRTRDAGRFCTRKCNFERLKARAVQRKTERLRRVRIERKRRKALRMLRPCRQCGQAMGMVKGHVHRACMKAYTHAQHLARYVSRAIHERRICLWCQQPFITKNAVSVVCGNKRCHRRWDRVRKKHGLSKDTHPDIIQGYRLLGDAYYCLQQRKEETLKNDGGYSDELV
jgi:hypothetical protein